MFEPTVFEIKPGVRFICEIRTKEGTNYRYIDFSAPIPVIVSVGMQWMPDPEAAQKRAAIAEALLCKIWEGAAPGSGGVSTIGKDAYDALRDHMVEDDDED